MFSYCDNNPVKKSDPSGQYAIIAGIIILACNIFLTGCSANPPSDYIFNDSKQQNCYSYAFGLPKRANPGDYSVSIQNLDYMYKDKDIHTPLEIKEYVLRDMEALGISVREVKSPSDKLDDEYIVAMKTSDMLAPGWPHADYHFAVQLSDGTWADKTGEAPSRWNALDGTALTWDLDSEKGYYNTESVYFAVRR